MIQLELVPRATAPVAAAIAEAFPGTSLRVQPAPGSGAGSAPSPAFAGISKPTADVQAVRAGLRPPFETALVDLSVARSIALGNALILPITGTAYFIDKGTDVGQATIHLQDQSNNPVNTLNVFPGDANNNIPFTFWMIENAAQAGKVLRIAYGTDVVFQPGLGGNVTFTGGVAILQTSSGSPQGPDQPVDLGDSFAVGVFFAASAGNINIHQLWNPGPKRVYVDLAEIANGTAADTFFIGIGNAQLGAATAIAPLNLKNGGAAGQAQSRFVQQAGFPNTRFDTLIGPLNTLVPMLKSGPIILDANFGVHMAQLTVNSITVSRYKWREF